MRRTSVTVVPFPGAERTRTSSIKLSITVKPMPERSAPPVVNMASRAFATSAMPMPVSRTVTRTLRRASSVRTLICISPAPEG